MSIDADIARLAKEKALGKIRKLLALAKDSGATEAEAEAAARQAASLMRRYQIDNADVIADELAQPDGAALGAELGVANPDGRPGYHFRSVPDWVGYVAVGCAALFDCVVDVVGTSEGVRVRFRGFSADAKVAAWTHDALCANVLQRSRAAKLGSRAATAAFRLGAGAELQRRLMELRRQQDASPGGSGGSTALAVIERKQALVQERFGPQKTERSKIEIQADVEDAFFAGKAAGREIQIQRGVEAKQERRQIEAPRRALRFDGGPR